MREPTVCCAMLTRDRPAMAARAVKSFRRQTYERKRLLILDTGGPGASFDCNHEIVHAWRSQFSGHSIGALRNKANDLTLGCDIIAHWDDDDWSHPNRLAEQVALLQSSGAECVVYQDMLFWDTRGTMIPHVSGAKTRQPGLDRAWLYTNPVPIYSLGSSMLYWRSAWEKTPFDDINHGEDGRFMGKVKTVGVSSVLGTVARYAEPRMVCGIHGGNSSPYRPESAPNSYRRVPEWDSYCAERMRL